MNLRSLMGGKPFFDTRFDPYATETSGFGLMWVSVPSRTTTFDARTNPALLTFISTSYAPGSTTTVVPGLGR